MSLLVYDMTNLHFEAEMEDARRKVGDSKERRVDPQIVVQLLADATEIPFGDKVFRRQHRRNPHHRAGGATVP
jgi:hypothetical protein